MDSINRHISKFSAVIDTNVLMSAAARDIILRLSEKDTFTVRWSNIILDELEKNLQAKLGLSPEQSHNLICALTTAFPQANVPKINIDPIQISAEQDKHVVAAAVQSASEVIITQNIKDFPPEELSHYHIEVQTPDEFLMHHFTLEETKTVQTVQELLLDLQKTPMEINDFLNHLESIGIINFANALRNIDIK